MGTVASTGMGTGMGRRAFLAGALAAGAAVGLGTASAPAAAAALGTQDWMAGLGDSTALQRMTIPGTHDSGATKGGLYVACQNTSIAQQLDSGIRFLDVRCRVTGGSFAIHHGSFFQDLMFGDVLVACWNFLAAHPGETVLMRVKQEYSGESDATFRAVFDDYLDNRGWRPLFRIADTLPALGQARGKVVLLADNGGLPGLRYGDGNVFDIQDDWNAEPFAKRGKIENHFRKAVQQPGKLFVNYVSTSAYMPPRWNSDRLNPQVHSFVDGGELAGRTGLGIVPMDFPNTRSGLVASLIRHN
ncbi:MULTISPECIES: phosphatidylinositol-specific phospholipase C [Streptomyces]|uniref:1-phosphatidylinositol phosphodiesterase n=1 Tax=Streptomyces virginiae TaxID=1961 RepID=A0ABQ3NV68_STRVG|nr:MULTISPECIES: phosphatidylinositol-specific phospholipase C [Streptomyces]MBP2344964.1 1-phosphatidylinositol phosphodiesterase [Streptomyces virginiae]MCI4082345.1 phosphatidylinositol-specific phospholipase C [Streptomyces sp. MMS21 TC-5]GGQ28132.1 1-phosphatidylinositol phosphodiesterase [Streptomyces virginiae]GHI16670.1 1-phosphatidylinositol phosphodiesterase [Streptomyces virginiae]GLV95490.1 1-phosphatidylinositol phosphodiesterase [Streptomyces lavendulae subsp. lavendulae]